MTVSVRFENVKFKEFSPREKLVAFNNGNTEEYDAIRLDYRTETGHRFSRMIAETSAWSSLGVVDEEIAYYASADEKVYDILRSLLGKDVVICRDYAGKEGRGAKTVNEMKTKEKNEMMIKYRVCLEVNAKSAMRVMLLEDGDKSHPANLVPLEGATIELSGDEIELSEGKQWEICRVVGDLCREGVEAGRNSPKRDACAEHLSYAHSLLDDFKRSENEIHLGDETRESILSDALWRVEAAMRCMGCSPDVDHDKGSSDVLTPSDIAEDVKDGQCRIPAR